ncbi:alpha/beta hydrolase [Streptomyces sp. ACA25]|uniref:alpha/beta hydrolase n=1 Tax=Streptomyces sp. ACA25 TaxID=3022596 RepID=UPI00230751C2|nr:alpha/beta hydrolase [Streptomyces sp. ACA25]MDB1086855.1 alpha/beta hydrolase [Streptomyces sp. ACA25]
MAGAGRHGIRTVAALLGALLAVTACVSSKAGIPAPHGKPEVADTFPPDGDDGTPGGPGSPPAVFTEQTLDWAECGAPTPLQGSGPAPGGPWRCAELTVPLDHSRPEGETLGIALIRAEATGSRSRVGSLVFNFGGPGGSGVAALPRMGERFDRLREAYDLVSFDPRGVGESAGVICLDDEELDAATQDSDRSHPRTPAQEAAFLDRKQEYAAACRANAGDLLPHLTTVATARDLDLLRHVLGDSKLHYYGASYGTKLGGVYAGLFPERVGRTVFDSVVDPTSDLVGRSLAHTAGFQLALDNYFTDCAERYGPDCPTGSGPAQGNEILAGLLAGLDREPLPTGSGRELTQSLAVTGVLASLYSENLWPVLTEALRQALDRRDGGQLLAAADRYNGRDQLGRYRNLHSANTAINCADFASRPGIEDVHRHRPEFAEISPVFGEYLVWNLLSCTAWPVTGERDQPHVRAPGARPILLIATTGDPATPYAGAERMQQELGEDVGVLLTYDGDGHGAFSSGNACVRTAVHAHLLSGATPEDGMICT